MLRLKIKKTIHFVIEKVMVYGCANSDSGAVTYYQIIYKRYKHKLIRKKYKKQIIELY